MENKNSTIKVWERDLIFFDTEFTGFELDKEVIEIGFIKVRAGDLSVIIEGDIKIRPEHIERATPEALVINGYNEAEWANDGVSRAAGLTEFLKHTQDAVLAGHNVAMDWMHLHNALERSGLKPNFFYKSLDTFSMAWQKLRGNPAFVKFSLEELGNYFGVDRGRAHRALDDARTTFGVYKKLIALP
ncbi:MAG: 3'-5' exonuclease [bacterium]|nr:3'-5' exonuclease [bacterium]